MSPALRVRITKRADGRSVLNCVRSDGSVTWQRQEGKQAGFFPLHDLAHFAVESELGIARGFFGLIAEGWNIDDTQGKGARGPVPEDAMVAEKLVGSFDAEARGGSFWPAPEFNQQARSWFENDGKQVPASLPQLAEADLARTRRKIADLRGLWRELPPGETLELEFPSS